MNSKYTFLAVAVIVVIAGGGYYLSSQKTVGTGGVEGIKTTQQAAQSVPVSQSPSAAPSDTPPQTAPPQESKGVYKDGTYEVMGNYQSPGGSEQIDVKLTLQNDVISDITVVPQATRSMSQHFQQLFTDNYKLLVIGKKIDSVQLDTVSGSSLTPKGFNDALSQIKQQAKV